jgi:uncharacterized membrane protein YgcG
MSLRTEPGRAASDAIVCSISIAAFNAIVCLISIVALVAPALGQPAAQQALEGRDPLAWLGCWDVMADPEDDSQESPEARQMICVVPGDAPEALDMTVLVDEQTVATETIITDGSRQPVSDGGCDGWIRSVLSEDRRRLYLQSEATCVDGGLKRLTGASMLVSGDRWVDIHVLWVDGEREVLIQRYRPIDAGIVRLPGALPTAMHNVRRAAAARLDVDGVIEALRIVDPAVVEAMLLESEASFGIDSDLLLRLDAAAVPGEITDLMVALSFPDYFSIDGSTVTRQPVVYYGGYWSPWYPYYGYGHYYHHGYAHGGAHRDKNRGGKVVRGRGYVSVRQTSTPPLGASGLPQSGSGGGVGMGGGSSGGGGGGSVGGSGYKSGNPTPARPAVPK